MKYLKYIVLSGLVGVAFWACKEDELRPIIHYNASSVLTAPAAGTVIELKEVNAAEELPAFTWTAADFGFNAATTYIVSVDKVGNNFAEPTTVGSSTGLSLVVTQGDLNTVLLAKGLIGETPEELEVRIIANVNSDAEVLVSEGVVITVIPYTTTIVYPQLQVPGSYQGWDPTNNTTIVYSAKADSKYEGYIYMGEENAKFKYTSGPSWDTNWGDDGDDGSLDLNGTDIPITTAGTYLLNVNLVTLTHTRQLANWGLIGDATPGGWDSDQDLIYDPVANKLTITLDLVPGSIKFRTNDSWDFNYGDNENNKTLDVNGDNIAITEAGNYTIDMLIFRTTKYKYAITKN